MGRTRTKKKAHSKASDAHPTPPSIQSLLEKSQSLIVQCDYELALRFIHRILEQDAKNAEAKEMLGVAFLETGEIEKAKLVSVF
jgi:Flp pilus assembly protein TadD